MIHHLSLLKSSLLAYIAEGFVFGFLSNTLWHRPGSVHAKGVRLLDQKTLAKLYMAAVGQVRLPVATQARG